MSKQNTSSGVADRRYPGPVTELLSSVPSGWQVAPHSAVYRRVKRVGYEDLPLLSVYRDLGIVEREGREDNHNRPSEDLASYQRVDEGDLVINKMKAWQGSVGVSEYEGLVSPAYFVFKPLGHNHGRYLHYLLRSDVYTAAYGSISKGIRVDQWDLDPQQHSRLPVLLPPLEEQRAIAAFLDRETARIDELVREQEQLLRLLGEERKAIVSRAIFHESEPVNRVRLGYFVNLVSGFAFPSESFSDDSPGIKLLRGANVGVGVVRWDDVVFWRRDQLLGLERFLLEVGDIVLGMDRPWISTGTRVAEVRSSDLPALLVQRVARMRARSGLSQRFLRLVLESSEFQASIETDLTGVSVPHISSEQILSFRVPAYSLTEQEQRVADAESRLVALESTSREVTAMVALLQERRSALISAAVRGQLDLRYWQQPEPPAVAQVA